jgi:hypothetical protein
MWVRKVFPICKPNTTTCLHIYSNAPCFWYRTGLHSIKKTEITAVGIRSADNATPLYSLKFVLTSPTGGGRSVGIVRSRTKAMGLLYGYISIVVGMLSTVYSVTIN